MTVTPLPHRSVDDPDLTARFTRDVLPLRDVLHRGARRLTNTEADAEDLLQDTLIRAFTGFRSFQEGSNLQAWLFKILYNKWISGYHARQRRPIETDEDAITDRVLARTGVAFRVMSAEAEVLATIPADDMTAALASLPDGFAEALYLTTVEGYTHAEVADMLGVPIGTVMSRIHRARLRLRIALVHRSSQDSGDDPDAQHVA